MHMTNPPPPLARTPLPPREAENPHRAKLGGVASAVEAARSSGRPRPLVPPSLTPVPGVARYSPGAVSLSHGVTLSLTVPLRKLRW